MGRDSIVSVATPYGLVSTGIESHWRQDFPLASRPTVGHPSTSTMGTGSMLGVKWPGRGIDHSSAPSTKVKERVELYIYSPSGHSWPVVG